MTRRYEPMIAWMVQGSAGQLAPFYGWQRTRKAMKAEFERRRWTMCPGMAIVKVVVEYPPVRETGVTHE